ncbi:ATP-binding protein [Pseudoduganella chitinolytica]|uniref:histidine kinase n=1 Tax=Pseudoduganella chitinolytica TaxID=34070 RepID=A0ABY8BGZ1_9BURK|nr:ATP-binding protein [Pseudoduganella chitinolytica]WEF35174.1 ATP-binding protein [Pseudoduganella chitinolytica]
MTQLNLPDTLHTILIVSAADQAALAQLLARLEFGVQVVNRGDAALAAIADNGVAMVLLDVALAGSARLELLPRLVHAAPGCQLPVLVLSAAPSEEERERALEAGAAGYLRLPCAPEEIVEKIQIELTVRHAWPEVPRATTLDMKTLEVNYHTLLAGSPDAILLFDAARGTPVDVNRNAERLFGRSSGELMRLRMTDLCPPAQPDGTPSREAIDTLLHKVLGGEVRVFPMTFQHSSGRAVDCEIRLVMLDKDDMRLLHMRLVDVTGQRLAEALRAGQNALLEMVARGAPLTETLNKLLVLMEAQAPGVVCTIQLLDEDGKTVRSGAAPSLPPAYLQALDGIPIGPRVGSCGTAMFLRESVIAADIARDPLWENYRELALRHGLRACWAMPILGDASTVLGSFAIYYRDPRQPRTEDERLIRVAVHLAGIAIERTRREAELARHRDHLEELVMARTAELRRAKEQAEQASASLAAALDNLRLTQDELVRRDKLAALGALVAGVAHELNTPIGNSLTVASTMSEHLATLRSRLHAGLRRTDLEQYLETAGEADGVIVRNLTRAGRLIASFKQVAIDTASSQRRRFRLDEFIAELVLPLLAATPQPRPTVRQEIAPDLVMDSYPGPLGQALSALFENAVVHGLAGRADGTVTIAARALDDGIVALSVGDDGAGIAPEHVDKVYDPFFTTRPGAGAAGLGLHVTHNIVTGVLGGRIALYSTPGLGTTFTLTLPAIAPP